MAERKPDAYTSDKKICIIDLPDGGRMIYRGLKIPSPPAIARFGKTLIERRKANKHLARLSRMKAKLQKRLV